MIFWIVLLAFVTVGIVAICCARFTRRDQDLYRSLGTCVDHIETGIHTETRH
jgi:hypothetical protein